MRVLTGEHWTIYVDDVLAGLRQLPSKSVHCCVTSPPYWNLREYGFAGQIGQERSPEEFVAALMGVFREVNRVLRDDGVLFVNLGDSFNAYNRNRGPSPSLSSPADVARPDSGWSNSAPEMGNRDGGCQERTDGPEMLRSCNADDQTRRLPVLERGRSCSDLEATNKIGIPWRFALAMQADGWILRQDVIWCLSGGTWLYARTEKGDAPAMLKDLVRLDPAKVQLWNGERWTRVVKWTENRPPKKTGGRNRGGFLEIEFRNGERVGCTAEHLWPTTRGLLPASELAVGDVVPHCQLPEPTSPKNLCFSDDDLGWLVGFYLAEGNPTEKGIRFSIHSSEHAEFERIRRMAENVDGTATFQLRDESGASIDVYSTALREMVCQYVSGTTSGNKRLTRKAWMRPNLFLSELVCGYLDGDAHFDAKNDRWRIGFTQNDGLAVDLRTAFARLGYSHHLNRCVHKNQSGSHPGWRGDVRKTASNHRNARVAGEVVRIRNSRARVYWDVTVEDEPHTFALASGILTHNCKPAPMPESVSGWRWVQCRVKVASAPVTLNGDYASTAHSNPQTGLAGHSGNATNGAKYIPCPGCDKCQDNGGMVLRRGSWRPTTSHEYIFQFVKTQNYFCDGDGSKEKAVAGANGSRFDKGKSSHHSNVQAGLRESDSAETRNMRSVWKLSPEGFKGAHFATFPSELPHRCLKAATSRGGCCSACGSQYAPIVESKRTATRPGTNSKVNRVSCHEDSPYQDHSGDICGNRDPQRHTTTTVVTGYRATCSCNAPTARPRVLDCFGGSMTTGQVAINMGCEFIGLEGNMEYAQLGVTRLETPWAPKAEKKPSKQKRKKHRLQKEMF